MHHEANVAAVDAHAERHRGDDDVQALFAEALADVGALLRVEAGVVGARVDLLLAQTLGEAFRVLARDAVDDRRRVRMALHGFGDLIDQIDARQHPIGQVGPIEGADQDFRLAQLQLLHDVVANARRRRRRERLERHVGEHLAQLGETSVLGAEVVPPLADAVRFVDRDGADLELRQLHEEAFEEQALRGHQQQAQRVAFEVALEVALLLRRQVAVRGGGRVAQEPQAVELVLHQRDQRRHDDGQPVGDQRRQLVAQRLAAAGRQDHERIASVNGSRDGLGLQRSQRIEAEHVLEHARDGAVLTLGIRAGGHRHGGEQGMRETGARSSPTARIAADSRREPPDLPPRRGGAVCYALAPTPFSVIRANPAPCCPTASLERNIAHRAAVACPGGCSMTARYEIHQEGHERFVFRLFDNAGQAVLDGLPNHGKVTVQLEVQHARESVRAGDRWARHQGDDGHFAVLHDKRGQVVGRTRKVATEAELEATMAAIARLADAPLLDRTRTPRQAESRHTESNHTEH